MKWYQLLFLWISALLLTNCDKERTLSDQPTAEEKPMPNEPTESESKVYFTFNSNDFQETSNSDEYLIIHDQEGELLDYRLYEPGSKVVFEEKGDELSGVSSLSVTLFTVESIENIDAHRIKTYTEIPLNSVWNPNAEMKSLNTKDFFEDVTDKKAGKTDQVSKVEGSYSIIVNNIPGIEKYNITSDATGVVTADYNPIDTTTLSLSDVQLTEDISYIFFIGDSEGGLKHIFFEANEDSNKLEFDYSNFREFDSYLETDLPENSYLFSVSKGHEDIDGSSRGYEMTVELDFDNPVKSKIGYVDKYKSFNTFFGLTLDENYKYNYLETSKNPLEKINILERPSFNILENSIRSFKFSTDLSYVRKDTSWRYEENMEDVSYVYTFWRINSSADTNPTVGSLPEELLSTYPKLNLDKMEHEVTNLYVQCRSYGDFIGNLWKYSLTKEPSVREWVGLGDSKTQ